MEITSCRTQKHLMDFAALTAIALCVVACIGAANKFPGPQLGWTTVGLAGGFGGSMLLLQGKERKWEMIVISLVSAALIAVGVCGGKGLLSARAIGIAILGTGAGGIMLFHVGDDVRKKIQSKATLEEEYDL